MKTKKEIGEIKKEFWNRFPCLADEPDVSASDAKPDVWNFIETLLQERERETYSVCMKEFDYPDLKKVRQTLTKSGEYSEETIDEIIRGLEIIYENKNR